MLSLTRQVSPLLILVFLVGCGGDASKQKALKTSLVALNAAREGFVTWDEHHQAQIVADSTSLEQGQAALKDYRDKRAPIVEGFTVAYSALAAAALEPSVEMLVEASKAAMAVYQLIKDLTGKDLKDGP